MRLGLRLGLRSQLVLGYLLIVVLTVAAVGLLTSHFTEQQFSVYISETGRAEARLLTPLFAEYYEQQGSWEGVGAYVAALNRAPWDILTTLDESAPAPWEALESSGEQEWLTWIRQVINQVSWQQAMWTLTRWIRGQQVLLTDSAGRVLADSGNEMLGQQLTSGNLEQGAAVVVGGREVGTVVVAAGLGVFDPRESAFLQQVNARLWIVGLVAVAVALALSGWLAHRLTAPARALTTAARELAAGNWDQQLPVQAGDEFGEMTRAFNEMATEITRQQALRRRLVADVAHELRTPLSVLRLELEAVADGLQPSQQAVDHVSAELGLLERLVEDLRLLAQADAGEVALNLQPEDLGTLVQRVVARWQGRASARGLTLTADVEPGLLPVRLDRLRITQVLNNLLSNALRHTHENGTVELRVASQDEGALLRVSVRDTGEGIAPDRLPHIFERFYRPDAARSRGTGGAGLGLSIARQAVELHGGRMWAQSELGQGSTFYFTLPLDSQEA